MQDGQPMQGSRLETQNQIENTAGISMGIQARKLDHELLGWHASWKQLAVLQLRERPICLIPPVFKQAGCWTPYKDVEDREMLNPIANSSVSSERQTRFLDLSSPPVKRNMR